MVCLNILEQTYDSYWASPTLGVPKMMREIRVVSDFYWLNQDIRNSPWPIPTIRELLNGCCNMTFMTALDQIMGYWGITTTLRVRSLLIIITHFGKFKYKKLPMRLKISADISQCEMTKLMDGIEGVLIYVDKLLIVTKKIIRITCQ